MRLDLHLPPRLSSRSRNPVLWYNDSIERRVREASTDSSTG